MRAVNYGYINGAIQLGSLDLRDEFYEQRGAPVEELEEIKFSPDKLGKNFKIGKLLSEPLQKKLIEFIRAHKANFSWNHHEIPGINPSIMMQKLSVDPKVKLVKQKRRSFNLERYTTINSEVENLMETVDL